MKILQILYSLGSGGAERIVIDLSNNFAELGHQVTLCVFLDDSDNINGFYKKEISNKVKYINFNQKEGFKLSRIIDFLKILTQEKPDVIHTHHNLVNYLFPISIFFRNVFFCHTIHNDAKKEIKSLIEYKIRKYFFSSNKFRVITISDETSKAYERYYGLKNYTQIVNGRSKPCKSKIFDTTNDYFKELRKKYSLIFLHIGRCAPQKNQKMLISSFHRLSKEFNNIALLIIGDNYNSVLGSEITTSAKENIFFLGPKHNIADYLYNADAFCLSSIHEGMPITLIEALACGCTPICTPVGGIINTIENGISGFISKTTSEDDYYNSLRDFVNNREKVKKESLIKNYNSKFSISNCTDQHINLYSLKK